MVNVYDNLEAIRNAGFLVAAIPNLRGNFAVLFHTHLYE
jgi:hypothetical protein